MKAIPFRIRYPWFGNRLCRWPTAVLTAVLFSGMVGLACCATTAGEPQLTVADIPDDASPWVRNLIRRTFATDPAIRREAVESLGKLQEEAVPAIPFLIQLVQDLEIRRSPFSVSRFEHIIPAASEALGKIGPQAFVPCVTKLGGDYWLCEVLGHMDDPRAAQFLVWMTADADNDDRGTAAECLGKSPARKRVPGAIAALASAVKDTRDDVRRDAIIGLGRFRDPDVVPVLLEVLRDPELEKGLRTTAIDSLGSVPDSRPVPGLLGILHNTNESDEVRGRAATTLGKLGEPSVIATLMAILRDPGEAGRVRGGAADGLGYTGDPEVLQTLMSVVDDAAYPRGAVLKGIVNYQGQAAIPLLIQYAKNDPGWEMRATAFDSLIDLTQGALDDSEVVSKIEEDAWKHYTDPWVDPLPEGPFGGRGRARKDRGSAGAGEQVAHRAAELASAQPPSLCLPTSLRVVPGGWCSRYRSPMERLHLDAGGTSAVRISASDNSPCEPSWCWPRWFPWA